jgi:hypothetical protein
MVKALRCARSVSLVAIVLASSFAAFGCGQGGAEGERADLTPEQKRQAMIDDIKNNKNMPESAKQMALANLQHDYSKK